MPIPTVPLAIIGAGPYGLALAAQCRHLGVEHILLGDPMALWREQMPRDMILRSRKEWHLDPLETDTLDRYAAETGLAPDALDPIKLPTYLGYASWFQERKGLAADRRMVVRLDRADGGFALTLDDGAVCRADQVVVTTGLAASAHIPDELAAILPPGRFTHSGDTGIPDLDGRSCLIVGGRQSAFEWAALAAEHGANQVHVVHRSATPAFAHADWTWTEPMLARFDTDPAWYRDLSETEQDQITQRMWRIGRLQLEPWLAPRLDRPEIRLWPKTNIASCREDADGRLAVDLDSGTSLTVDRIVLATGYRMDVTRLGFLTAGNVLDALRTRDGLPLLDQHFHTSVPGLYFTSKFAVGDFGHFFDFTAAARVSARIIASRVLVGLSVTGR